MGSRIWAIALTTFREAIRSKVLYSVLFFASLLVGVSAFFGAVSIGDQSKVIKDFGLLMNLLFGVVATIIIGVSLLGKEISRKTIYNILSKPIGRSEFIVGKYLGLVATVASLTMLMGSALVAFVACFEGRIDWLLFYGIFAAILELLVIAAIAVFFSTITITTTLTGLFTLGTFLAGHSIDYLRKLAADSYLVTAETGALLRAVDVLLPNLSLFNLNSAIVYGIRPSPEHLMWATTYSVSYAAAALLLASLLFARRELN